MSTEAAEPKAPEAPAAPVAQNTDLPNTLLEQSASVLSSLGNFLDPNDKAELEKMQSALLGTPAPASAAPAPAATPEGGNGDEPTPEGTPAATPAPAGDEKKSVLGIGKKTPATPAAITIEKPEDILNVIKTKYGQDIKDVKELPKFFESVDKMRANAQKFEDTQKKLTQFEEEYINLPSQFHKAVELYIKGEDFTKAFTESSKIDFNKPADKQDVKELVNHYFKGKFTEEDFKDPEDKSEKLLMAEEAAKVKFEAEKQMFDNKRALSTDKANLVLKAREESVNSSVKMLTQRFPDMDEIALKQVESALKGGPEKILSYFLNSDGTYKPEAAVKLMMAEVGESEISALIQIAERQTETRVNEELLSRGANTPTPARGSSAPPQQLDPETQKKITEIERLEKLGQKLF